MELNQISEYINNYNTEHFKELNGRSIISVSKLKEYVAEPFNKEATAQKCADKAQNDPNNKYYGKSVEEIIKMWEDKANESMRYGSLLDEYTEMIFSGDKKKLEVWKLDNNYYNDVRLKTNCDGFDEFYRDITAIGYVYVGREITLYVQTPDKRSEMPFNDNGESSVNDGNNLVTGRLDCLFYNLNTHKFLIIDWKTTDDIKRSAFAGKKMKGPAYKWEDCNMSEYTIQLHVYKSALCNTYKLATPDMVKVAVCNLLKEREQKYGRLFKIQPENFEYEPNVINELVDFSIRKRELLKNL